MRGSTSLRKDSAAKLYVLGTGGVGGALLGQLADRLPSLRSDGLRLSLAGVANSRRMRLGARGLDPGLGGALLTDGEPGDLGALTRAIESTGANGIVVDVTASEDVPGLYPRWLDAGAAVVTANKLGLCGPMAGFGELRSRRVYYETTAGAGLPIVGTIRSLVETGDRVRRIEGVFSGTLGFLFHELARGIDFSAAVADAASRGYTEPDPDEDLSGQDVARKLVILARTASFDLELEDVEVESLVGRANELQERGREARAEEKRLAYLASFQDGKAHVGVEAVEAGHPAARLTGTDNVFLVETERYGGSPIVVQGSGAGPEVTAGGVFADILKACAERP